MRTYVTKVFRRFQRREAIRDADLAEAIDRAERGLVDADLGHGLIKQRIARPGAGRRGGFRTIIAYRQGARAIFIFGFPKSARDNITAADLRDLAATGVLMLGLTAEHVDDLIANGELYEVAYGQERKV